MPDPSEVFSDINKKYFPEILKLAKLPNIDMDDTIADIIIEPDDLLTKVIRYGEHCARNISYQCCLYNIYPAFIGKSSLMKIPLKNF